MAAWRNLDCGSEGAASLPAEPGVDQELGTGARPRAAPAETHRGAGGNQRSARGGVGRALDLPRAAARAIVIARPAGTRAAAKAASAWLPDRSILRLPGRRQTRSSGSAAHAVRRDRGGSATRGRCAETKSAGFPAELRKAGIEPAAGALRRRS